MRWPVNDESSWQVTFVACIGLPRHCWTQSVKIMTRDRFKVLLQVSLHDDVLSDSFAVRGKNTSDVLSRF